MYCQENTELLNFAVERYSEPKPNWSRTKIDRRIMEIYSYEKILYECMNKPFTDPNDILENYEVYCEWAISVTRETKEMLKLFKTMLRVVKTLQNKIRRNLL